MESRAVDVLAIGTLVADEFGIRDGKEKFRRMQLAAGGDALNVSIALRRLWHSSAVVGCVGDDEQGRYLLSVLQNSGVVVQGVKVQSEVPTSHSEIVNEGGGKHSLDFHPGANAALVPSDIDLNKWSAKIVHCSSVFTMDGIDGQPTAEIMEEARRRGWWTTLDNGWDRQGRWLKLIEPCLEVADFYFPNEDEARQISGLSDPREICDFFQDRGVGVVVLKVGAKGVYLRTSTDFIHVPPFEVEVRSTVGAGDCFAAGFLAGLLEGQTLEHCAVMGCAAGALACTAEGAHDGLASRRDLEEMVSTRLPA